MPNMSMDDGVPGGGSGDGDNPTFTLDGLSKEYKVGDALSAEDAQKIADASGGMLKFENGVLSGENPDGSGPVHIEVGKPLTAGDIHDIHHTVPSSGGAGKG